MNVFKKSIITGPGVARMPQGPAGVGGIVPASSPSSSDDGLPRESGEGSRGELATPQTKSVVWRNSLRELARNHEEGVREWMDLFRFLREKMEERRRERREIEREWKSWEGSVHGEGSSVASEEESDEEEISVSKADFKPLMEHFEEGVALCRQVMELVEGWTVHPETKRKVVERGMNTAPKIYLERGSSPPPTVKTAEVSTQLRPPKGKHKNVQWERREVVEVGVGTDPIPCIGRGSPSSPLERKDMGVSAKPKKGKSRGTQVEEVGELTPTIDREGKGVPALTGPSTSERGAAAVKAPPPAKAKKAKTEAGEAEREQPLRSGKEEEVEAMPPEREEPPNVGGPPPSQEARRRASYAEVV